MLNNNTFIMSQISHITPCVYLLLRAVLFSSRIDLAPISFDDFDDVDLIAVFIVSPDGAHSGSSSRSQSCSLSMIASWSARRLFCSALSVSCSTRRCCSFSIWASFSSSRRSISLTTCWRLETSFTSVCATTQPTKTHNTEHSINTFSVIAVAFSRAMFRLNN